MNNKFIEWVKNKYGKIREVKVTRGKIYNYLDYLHKGQVIINMHDYIKIIIEDFPQDCLKINKIRTS